MKKSEKQAAWGADFPDAEEAVGSHASFGADFPDASGRTPTQPSAVPPVTWRDVGLKYADMLPMFGGGVGGMAGLAFGGGLTAGLGAAPAAIAGAGVGGATGAGLRDMAYRALGEPVNVPPGWEGSHPALQQAGRMAGAGTEQMLWEAGGQGMGAIPQLFAKPFAKGAVRPTSKMLEEFSDLDLPQEALARDVLDPRTATRARQSSARDARRMVANATRSTVPQQVPVSIPQQTTVHVPTQTAVPAAGTVQDAAAALAREGEALSEIISVGKQYGYDPQEILALMSSNNTLDLGQAARRGLTHKELLRLRTLAQNIGTADAAAANAAPTTRTTFRPIPATVTPSTPNATKTVMRPEFQYEAQQFIDSGPVNRLRNQLRNAGLPADAQAELDAFFESFTQQHATRRSPIKWYKLAQSLQRESKPFYNKRAGQGAAQAVTSSPAVMDAKAALATAIKEGLGEDISGLRAQDANTRVLIALEKALKRSHRLTLTGPTVLGGFLGDVAARSLGHQGAAEIPATIAAAYAAHAATSPAVLGTAARVARSPATRAVASAAPRTAAFTTGLMQPPRRRGGREDKE